MDAALAQLPTYHLRSSIPHEIYQPLLDIAQQGYDANDILQWYLSIKRDLHRIDTANVAVQYSLTPPFSVCSPVPHDPPAPLFSNEHTSPVDANIRPQDFYEAPQTNLDLWSGPFSLFPSEQNQLNVTTSTSIPPLRIGQSAAENQNSIVHLSSPWSPTAPTFPNLEVNELSAVGNEAEKPSNHIINSLQWFSPDSLNAINNVSRKRSASDSSPYHVAISNTAMPLLVPSETSTQTSGSPFVPVTTSTEVTYLPPISIIPSRKRRKTLPKGVKKFIQPLQLQKQSIS